MPELIKLLHPEIITCTYAESYCLCRSCGNFVCKTSPCHRCHQNAWKKYEITKCNDYQNLSYYKNINKL